ncbi:MAG: site-specific integrase [Deltaproteobacteria bacterium]|nr:site-specific integrase [Deltaproteobacteria bacterium]
MSLMLYKSWDIFYKRFSSKQVIGKTDLGYWKNHIEPYFKNRTLSSITTESLLDFTTAMEEKQLSPQTIHHCLGLIKRIFNKMCLLDAYRGKLPIFIMPKYDNKRMRFLTKKESALLLDNLCSLSPLWFDISNFALNTGMRASEIFNLRCSNIHLDSSSVYILDSKNSMSRIVPLNDKAKLTIEKYLSNRSDYLFTNNSQKINQASKIFRLAVNQSGLNRGITDRRQQIVFHSLRHTFASWLVQSGVSLEVIGKILGHKTIQITQRYAHIVAKQERNAVKILDMF